MPSLKEFLESNVHRLQRRIGGETLISSLKKKKSASIYSENCCRFTDEIWNAIFHQCSPFDLYSWRRVSKNFKRLIDGHFNNILYLHADRRNIASMLGQESNANGNFYRHRSAQILLSLDTHSAMFVVHERWTPKDISKLFQAIQLLAPSIRNVSLDMGIVELITAGLSNMDFNRWHSFQCYLKTLDGQAAEDSVHIQCNPSANCRTFFPNVTEFTVQIGERDYSTLTRLMDYSVDAQTLFSLDKIELFRAHFISSAESQLRGSFTSEERFSRKRTSKHLQNFKKWIGASNLGERYCQQYS
uniref:F-box domain-containing protein n=1 Tax=Elaeophora elaphi TaxID=1147741 RepID=A0A0R3RH25_9BILA